MTGQMSLSLAVFRLEIKEDAIIIPDFSYEGNKNINSMLKTC